MSISFDHQKEDFRGGTSILTYEDKAKGLSVSSGAFCAIRFELHKLAFNLQGGDQVWEDVKGWVRAKDSKSIINYAIKALLKEMNEKILTQIISYSGYQAHHKLISEYENWQNANPMLNPVYPSDTSPCNLCGQGEQNEETKQKDSYL